MSERFLFTTDVTGEIVNIPVGMLTPHPDNVREDVGDVSELAESIKAKGVLQNLTVVPDPDGVKRYFVVIGNRRLAAAEAAGLETLPCVIASMTYQEQIETMLLENIQRTDLTPVEQAAGFQMMIDFGDTVAEVSRKTGFGETTIRRRLEVAKLDRAKLKKALGERQISMFDLDRLSQIEDVKERNKLLDTIGTADFNIRLSSAKIEQQRKRNLPEIKKRIKELGAKPIRKEDRWSSKYDMVSQYIDVARWDGEDFRISDKGEGDLLYWLEDSYGDLVFYRKREKAKPEKRSKKELAAEAAARDVLSRLRETTRRHYELRTAFADGLTVKKASADKWLRWAARLMATDLCDYYYHDLSREEAHKRMGIDRESYLVDKPVGRYEDPAAKRLRIADAAATPDGMARAVVAFLDDGPKQIYYYSHEVSIKNGVKPSYRSNKRLDLIYEFLCDMGYEMSDEEKKMQAGDPELFGE